MTPAERYAAALRNLGPGPLSMAGLPVVPTPTYTPPPPPPPPPPPTDPNAPPTDGGEDPSTPPPTEDPTRPPRIRDQNNFFWGVGTGIVNAQMPVGQNAGKWQTTTGTPNPRLQVHQSPGLYLTDKDLVRMGKLKPRAPADPTTPPANPTTPPADQAAPSAQRAGGLSAIAPQPAAAPRPPTLAPGGLSAIAPRPTPRVPNRDAFRFATPQNPTKAVNISPMASRVYR